jgi:hypothetical protein
MKTTPTGVPIILCGSCGIEHTATRRHCSTCGRPSFFIDPEGVCLDCR